MLKDVYKSFKKFYKNSDTIKPKYKFTDYQFIDSDNFISSVKYKYKFNKIGDFIVQIINLSISPHMIQSLTSWVYDDFNEITYSSKNSSIRELYFSIYLERVMSLLETGHYDYIIKYICNKTK